MSKPAVCKPEAVTTALKGDQSRTLEAGHWRGAQPRCRFSDSGLSPCGILSRNSYAGTNWRQKIRVFILITGGRLHGDEEH